MKHTFHLKFLFALMFAFIALCAGNITHAQTANAAALAGRVSDPQGAAVPGAIVTLYARERPTLRLATVTDASGVYRFENLAAGEYLVEAEAAGFARTAASEVRIEWSSTATLDIGLEIAGVRGEVVVTASGTAQTIDETSKALTVVSRREIDERDEFSISDALRTVPGLRVQQQGGPGRITSIRTRGLRPQDTAVLIDGLRLRDATAPQNEPSGLLSDLLVTNISQVEILRGSGSSLYGTNAIGGTVNLVTDEGGGRARGQLLAEGGALGLFRGRAQIAGGARRDRIVYSAGVTHLNVARGVDRDDAARNTSGQGRILFRLTPTTTLAGRVYATDAFVQLNESPDVIANSVSQGSGILRAVPLAESELRRLEAGTPLGELNIGGANFIPSANDPDSRQASRIFSGALVFAARPSEAFGYTVSYQGLANSRTNRNGPGGRTFQPIGGATLTDARGRIHTLNARADFNLGRQNLVTAGYEFESESFRNGSFPVNPASNFETDVTQRSHTVFIQDQLHLLEDRLQLSAAFRAQVFSLDEPRFTPSSNAPFQDIAFVAPPNAYTGDGSIAYLFRSTGTKLRAHVGNGYRSPSLFERFGASQFGALGDPRLRPERSVAFDVGVDQSLYDNRVRASLTYFYTRLQEVIGFDFSGTINPATDPFGRFGGYANTGGGLARGVEIGISSAPTRTLDVFTSYTFTNSDDRVPKFGDIIRAYVVSDHQFSIVATQRVDRRLYVNFDFVAASDYLAPVFSSDFRVPSRVFSFDGFTKADLGVSYTLPLDETRTLRFFGKVDNLFDSENYENGFRSPGRAARAGVVFSF